MRFRTISFIVQPYNDFFCTLNRKAGTKISSLPFIGECEGPVDYGHADIIVGNAGKRVTGCDCLPQEPFGNFMPHLPGYRAIFSKSIYGNNEDCVSMECITVKPGLVISYVLLMLAAFCIVAPVGASDPAIQVYSNPSGANVVVDNFWYDTTPATIYSVGNGWHTVYVTMSGYEPYSESVYVDDSTRVVVANLVQTSDTGFLSVTSQPSSADIYVDGVYHGNAPMVIGNLWAGSHTLLVRMAGYNDVSDVVTISPGITTSYNAILTSSGPGTGSLQIDSTPAGAAVYVDGNYQGTTPASGAMYINQLTPGIYTVMLRMQDYQAYTQSAIVSAGIVNDLHITLVPVTPGPTQDTTGQVQISSVPSGANILLDNAYKGITPLTLPNIPEGTHTLTLTLNGYQDYTTTVNVVGGGTVAAAGALTALPQTTATKSPVPFVVVLAALVICAGFVVSGKRK